MKWGECVLICELSGEISVSLDFLLTSLESKLRLFACLTKGDIIGIEYNEKVGTWVEWV